MLRRFFSIVLLPTALLVAVVLSVNAADPPRFEEPKHDCCRHESADIARWHKNADRLYSQFKPREAVADLSKILQVDSRNFEALVKLARAHIDIGDLMAAFFSKHRRARDIAQNILPPSVSE